MRSDHIFYCRPKLIFQHSGIWKYIKLLGVLSLKQIEKSYSLIIVWKIIMDLFQQKRWLKREYCGNESLRLASNHMKVSQMTLFYTTKSI